MHFNTLLFTDCFIHICLYSPRAQNTCSPCCRSSRSISHNGSCSCAAVLLGNEIHVLDVAAKLDQCAEFLCKAEWGDVDFPPPFGREALPEVTCPTFLLAYYAGANSAHCCKDSPSLLHGMCIHLRNHSVNCVCRKCTSLTWTPSQARRSSSLF